MPLPRIALVSLLALSAPVPLWAETTVPEAAPILSVAEVGQVMRFDAMFDILREEGIAQANEMAEAMMPANQGPGWDLMLDKVYDLRLIRATFNAALRRGLSDDPAALAAGLAFYGSELGQRALGLEAEARRAFLDPALEDAARANADMPDNPRDPKWRLIDRMIAAGNLLDSSVASSMSANLNFSLGLQETGAFGIKLPLEKLAADTWGQEEALRADTQAWLRAYFGLAYAPLTEAELASYVDFLESPEGQRFVSVVQAAYDTAFRQVAHDLGVAAGRTMQAKEI